MPYTFNPLISIILPTFNRGHIIRRAIDSVISQSCKEWELLIIDDASTDTTQHMVQPYLERDSRVKYVKHTNNLGVFGARNTGISQAKGAWVSLLDSDDEYIPGALSRIATCLQQTSPTIGIVQFNIEGKLKTGDRVPLGFRPQDITWDTYQPTYEEVAFKIGILDDMHRCLRSEVAKTHPFCVEEQGQESNYYANLAKEFNIFQYRNVKVVCVHNDCDQRLSLDGYMQKGKWKYLVNGSKAFLRDHDELLQKYPEKKIKQYLAISRYLFYERKLSFLLWLGRALWVNPAIVLKQIFLRIF